MKVFLITALLFIADLTNSFAQGSSIFEKLNYYQWKSSRNFTEKDISKLKLMDIAILDDSTSATPVLWIEEKNLKIKYPGQDQSVLYKYEFDETKNILTILVADKKYRFQVYHVYNQAMTLEKIK